MGAPIPFDKQRLAVSNGSSNSVKLQVSKGTGHGERRNLHDPQALFVPRVQSPVFNLLGSNLPNPSPIKVHSDPLRSRVFTNPLDLFLRENSSSQSVFETNEFGRSVMDIVAELEVGHDIFQCQVMAIGRDNLISGSL